MNIKSTMIIIMTSISFCKGLSQGYNIVLGRPTDTSITVSVMMDQKAEFYLEYGETSTTYDRKTDIFSVAANDPQHVLIHPLRHNSRYFYRLIYKTDKSFVASPQFHFQTQRAEGSSFVFTVEADEHLYDKKGIRSMYNVTLQNQAADDPDFLISLGDIFGDDHEPFTITSGELDELHRDYRPLLGSICHSIPFYVCLGNHEGENDYYQSISPPDNLCYRATLWRKYYYPNPFPDGFYTGNTTMEPYGIEHPENYFAWTWGDALFVVLDVYRTQSYDSLDPKPQGWNWTLGLKQYSWLKKTLEESNSKFKFVFAHHLRGQGRGGVLLAKTNEWGGYQNSKGNYTFPTYRPGWAKPIHQLFVDNKVTMFIQGHDHVFAHEELDGIQYIAAPMAADSTYQIGMLANADAYVSDTVDGTGHLRFEVRSDCVQMDYIKAYLPQDTLSGDHKNREIGFSLDVGDCRNTSQVDDAPQRNEFTLVPNPACGSFVLTMTAEEKVESIKVTDIFGREVYQTNRCFSGMRIFTNGWAPGVYIISVHGYRGSIALKVIVQE
ncbi:MAG: metallophosphoesterase [Saprospiraceae bacterium]|nr:metallophosphoesterase [Saprospiraceae bacterium]HMW40085.1 metallophosphoesterase [Saprospiraceae bacterium]HMX88248.1 metallophosphoesterase [Saprospiraceae bacterium]HMZ40709.1 metallophosphoesterase [Saprospiraceae bacterium]HNA64856.1 metallophosphoesterase [Saprospiraceae bacterium]